MKIKEIKKLDSQKIQDKLRDLRNKSRELRFSIANNQLKKVRELRETKKSIARILTIMNKNRHSAAGEASKKSSDSKETK